MAAAHIDELRQEGEEEYRCLRVEEIDDEAVAEQPRFAKRLQHDIGVRRFDAAKNLLEAEPDQIGSARIFDDGEGQRRRGEHRRQSECCGGDMDERRCMDAEIRDEAGEPTLLDRAPDDVEYGWSGNEQQHKCGADEQPEIGGTGRYDFHGLVHFVDRVQLHQARDEAHLSTMWMALAAITR